MSAFSNRIFANMYKELFFQEKAGFKLVDKPKSFYYQDPTPLLPGEDGSRLTKGGLRSAEQDSEICIRFSDLGSGWSTKSRRSSQLTVQVEGVR